MKRIFIILITFSALSGCAQWQATKTTIREGGAQAADEALKVTIWQLCNATTYGAVKRRFSSNQEQAQALRTLCNGSQETDLVVE